MVVAEELKCFDMPLAVQVCFYERVAMTVKQVFKTSAWLRSTMSDMCWHAFEHSLLGEDKTLVERNRK